MMMIPSNKIFAFAVAGFLSAPAVALAQSAQTPPSAPAAPSPGAGKAAPVTPEAARVETRIKQLHAQLKITPAEQTQWDQFAQVMRDNARDMDQAIMQRAQQFSSMTAVEDMKSYEEIAAAHVEHLQKLLPVFQSLYDSMSAEQKKQADDVFRERSESHAQAGKNG
jgi:periplasmic protein CpxP/Spy